MMTSTWAVMMGGWSMRSTSWNREDDVNGLWMALKTTQVVRGAVDGEDKFSWVAWKLSTVKDLAKSCAA